VSRLCGGGAAITPEMEAALPPPQPLAGKLLLVVAGEEIAAVPEAARFTTDASGRFETKLPQGTWCVFDAGRKLETRAAEPPGPATSGADAYTDEACLAHERRRCDEVIRVSDKGRNVVQVQFYEACPEVYNQPCYRGPMPP
jgi:hypothetical protein